MGAIAGPPEDFGWLWGLLYAAFSAIIGAIAGWAAFMGSTRTRLDTLEAAVKERHAENREDHAQMRAEIAQNRIADREHIDRRFAELSDQIKRI